MVLKRQDTVQLGLKKAENLLETFSKLFRLKTKRRYKMTLEEYIEKAKKGLDEFANFYIKEQEKEPEFWPTTMDHGEWDEQFRLYYGA